MSASTTFGRAGRASKPCSAGGSKWSKPCLRKCARYAWIGQLGLDVDAWMHANGAASSSSSSSSSSSWFKIWPPPFQSGLMSWYFNKYQNWYNSHLWEPGRFGHQHRTSTNGLVWDVEKLYTSKHSENTENTLEIFFGSIKKSSICMCFCVSLKEHLQIKGTLKQWKSSPQAFRRCSRAPQAAWSGFIMKSKSTSRVVSEMFIYIEARYWNT